MRTVRVELRVAGDDCTWCQFFDEECEYCELFNCRRKWNNKKQKYNPCDECIRSEVEDGKDKG